MSNIFFNTPEVLESIGANYLQKDITGRILWLKRLLWHHGYPVPVNGQMDAETMTALAKMDTKYDSESTSASVDTFLNLYMSVPLTPNSLDRAKQFDRLLTKYKAAGEQKVWFIQIKRSFFHTIFNFQFEK
jgi:hypothetical protein